MRNFLIHIQTEYFCFGENLFVFRMFLIEKKNPFSPKKRVVFLFRWHDLIGLFISIVAIDFESKRGDDDVGSFPLCPKQSLQMANEATDILFMSKNDSLIIISSDWD